MPGSKSTVVVMLCRLGPHMPQPSKAYKKKGGAPTFKAEAIHIGSLVAPTTFVSECNLGGDALKVSCRQPFALTNCKLSYVCGLLSAVRVSRL